MMPAADLVCNLYQWLVLINAKLFQHFCTDDGMRFHNLKFFFCQFSRFIQDFFIHTDFSDIMQRRSKCDHGSGIPIQMILFGFLRQSLQKHLRKFVNVKHMASALSVSKLHNMTENMNQHLAVFLFFVDLRSNQGSQPTLLRI